MIEQFLIDFNIEYFKEGYKQCRKDWYNIKCPFCYGSPHLGISKNGGINCYQCGKKSIRQFLNKILNVPYYEISNIISKYFFNEQDIFKSEQKLETINSKIKLPYGADNLNEYAKKYLIKRGFEPDYIGKKYKIKSTSYLGDYGRRIIIPIYYKDQLVSYIGRDYTNKQIPKYKTCKKEEELVHHKKILYGLDYILSDKLIIIVEGVFDVWKIGYPSVATFGIKFKLAQLKHLLPYKKIVIYFDNEPQAQNQAKKMKEKLTMLNHKNVHIYNYQNKNDPGDLMKEEIEKVKNEIRKIN